MTKQMMVVIAVIVFIFFRAFIIEPGSLEVSEYRIEDSNLVGVRVAFLSDFNLKKKEYKRLKKIIKLTNQAQPDLVLLGGDFVAGPDVGFKKSMKITKVAEGLRLINAPKYAVLGDDDWYTNNTKAISDALRQNGIMVLGDNAIRRVVKGRYVDIIGIMDRKTHHPDIPKATKSTRMPRIMFTHNPDIYYDVMEDVSVILAGHTHGGQIIIPFTPALFVPSQYHSDFASGYITSTHNKMIISKGLGTSKFPARFNCKPEIVIVDFIKPGTGAEGKRK